MRNSYVLDEYECKNIENQLQNRILGGERISLFAWYAFTVIRINENTGKPKAYTDTIFAVLSVSRLSNKPRWKRIATISFAKKHTYMAIGIVIIAVALYAWLKYRWAQSRCLRTNAWAIAGNIITDILEIKIAIIVEWISPLYVR